jgi:hypothetical protein
MCQVFQFFHDQFDIFQYFFGEHINTTFNDAIILPALLFDPAPLLLKDRGVLSHPHGLPECQADSAFGLGTADECGEYGLRVEIYGAELLGQVSQGGLRVARGGFL